MLRNSSLYPECIYGEYCLLDCYTMKSGRLLVRLQSNRLPPPYTMKRWRECIPLKYWIWFIRLHVFTSQKRVIFTVTVIGASNFTCVYRFSETKKMIIICTFRHNSVTNRESNTEIILQFKIKQQKLTSFKVWILYLICLLTQNECIISWDTIGRDNIYKKW